MKEVLLCFDKITIVSMTVRLKRVRYWFHGLMAVLPSISTRERMGYSRNKIKDPQGQIYRCISTLKVGSPLRKMSILLPALALISLLCHRQHSVLCILTWKPCFRYCLQLIRKIIAMVLIMELGTWNMVIDFNMSRLVFFTAY
jgi:hypothetical protein